MEELDGWVLLFGVDHTVNTAIHYAESLAGRKSFVRWALTREGVRQCPGFPGCSNGFWQAKQYLEPITKHVSIGSADVSAIRLTVYARTACQCFAKRCTGVIMRQPGL
jgi:aminoglycoside 3-N-acetyltransferase